MNDINEMPPKCQYCPYWEVCKFPWVCPDIGDKKPETHDKCTESHACDLISRQALCEYALNQKDKSITANDIMRFPSAQPDKEKISDALYNVYRNKGTSTSAEGVAAIKYYIAEIWRELYGEEGLIWLKK